MKESGFDTTRAIVNLITTGTILRYPDVRLLFSHGGGVAPMLQQRVEFYIKDGRKGSTIPNERDNALTLFPRFTSL